MPSNGPPKGPKPIPPSAPPPPKWPVPPRRPPDTERAAWVTFIACLLAADDTAGAG